jgi:hypothetical protein
VPNPRLRQQRTRPFESAFELIKDESQNFECHHIE